MNYYFINDPIAQKAACDARKARLANIALENTPPKVRVIEIRKSLTGRACYESGELSAPRPFTRKALYIFLHECAHFALHANGKRRKRYMEEMEAEQWAHARMREADIPVPRQMTRRAKAYVRRKMRQAFMRCATSFDSRALGFTGSRQIGTVKS